MSRWKDLLDEWCDRFNKTIVVVLVGGSLAFCFGLPRALGASPADLRDFAVFLVVLAIGLGLGARELVRWFLGWGETSWLRSRTGFATAVTWGCVLVVTSYYAVGAWHERDMREQQESAARKEADIQKKRAADPLFNPEKAAEVRKVVEGALRRQGAASAETIKASYQRLQELWGQSNYEPCTEWFPEDAAEGVTLQDAVKRRGIPDGLVPHVSSPLGISVAGEQLTGKVRSFVRFAREGGNAEPMLLVIEETFVMAGQDGKYLVVDYQPADVTEKTVKTLKGFVETELAALRDVNRPVAGRQSNGGLVCYNLWTLGQPRQAWPIVQEMYELGTDKVSPADLEAMQKLLKSLVKMEAPPAEYQELVEKIQAMKPGR